MRFQLAQRFDAPMAEVEAAYLDPELPQRLAGLSNLAEPELLEHHSDDDVVRQRVRYRYVGQLPSAATAFINPARLTWVQESVFDRSTGHTRVSIQPDHYPDRLRCEAIVWLDETDGVTDRMTNANLRVFVPLGAARVERAIISGLRDHAEAEAEVVRAWLEERRVGGRPAPDTGA